MKGKFCIFRTAQKIKEQSMDDLKNFAEPVKIIDLGDIDFKKPAYAFLENVDLVIIKYDSNVSVLYGRCLHRGALLSDGHVEGENLICGLHNWDYRIDTGISEYNNKEVLYKFKSLIQDGGVYIDAAEVRNYHTEHPQLFAREEYLGNYADTHPEKY